MRDKERERDREKKWTIFSLIRSERMERCGAICAFLSSWFINWENFTDLRHLSSYSTLPTIIELFAHLSSTFMSEIDESGRYGVKVKKVRKGSDRIWENVDNKLAIGKRW